VLVRIKEFCSKTNQYVTLTGIQKVNVIRVLVIKDGIYFTLYPNPDQQIYRMSQEKCARLREGVPYVKVYRYNPKHLNPKLNGYGDNGERSLKF
jgi:hypothetical protein